MVKMFPSVGLLALFCLFAAVVPSLGYRDTFPDSVKRAVIQKITTHGDPAQLEKDCLFEGNQRVRKYEYFQGYFEQHLDIHFDRKSAAFRHAFMQQSQRTSKTIRDPSKIAGYFWPAAAHKAVLDLGLNKEEAQYFCNLASTVPEMEGTAMDSMDKQVMETLQLLSSNPGAKCPERVKQPVCPPALQIAQFRTADGFCNNIEKPLWGNAFTTLARLTSALYEGDSQEDPRTSSISDPLVPLPNARIVSLELHARSTPFTLSEDNTHMLMQWGQFMDHDLNLSPFTRDEDGTLPVCCGEDLAGIMSQAEITRANTLIIANRPECVSIIVDPLTDPVHRQTGRTCLPLVRSEPATSDCSMSVRQQVNALTAFIDGSMVYGSTQEEQDNLREINTGFLRVSKETVNNLELLPRDPNTECTREGACFLAGDERVNEQPALASMHTAFLREHNRVAKFLENRAAAGGLILTPEETFQLARMVVAAEIQQVTYEEFLPVLLGESTLEEFDLKPIAIQQIGHVNRNKYNPQVNPSITNVFSTAAYRMGHTLIRSFMSVNTASERFTSLRVGDQFFNPDQLLNETSQGLDALLTGMLYDRVQTADRKCTTQVCDRLFSTVSPSLDLMAINLQRGREHGLNTYAQYRRVVGLPLAGTGFNSLEDHDMETRDILSKLYNTAEDIDIFSGAISERAGPAPGILGPLLQKLIANQFRRAKQGDRFFYENSGPFGLTDNQLRTIRKRTLSSILCDNLKIELAQLNAFKTILKDDPSRLPIPCGRHPKLDLDAFVPVKRVPTGLGTTKLLFE